MYILVTELEASYCLYIAQPDKTPLKSLQLFSRFDKCRSMYETRETQGTEQ